VEQMTMEFCHFRDFAVPLLGLSTRYPSIHEMRVTQLLDSISRAPHFPDAAGTGLCLSKLAGGCDQQSMRLREIVQPVT